MRYTVVLTSRALGDLEHAREFLRQSAPDLADRWYAAFLEALLKLEQVSNADLSHLKVLNFRLS